MCFQESACPSNIIDPKSALPQHNKIYSNAEMKFLAAAMIAVSLLSQVGSPAPWDQQQGCQVVRIGQEERQMVNPKHSLSIAHLEGDATRHLHLWCLQGARIAHCIWGVL